MNELRQYALVSHKGRHTGQTKYIYLGDVPNRPGCCALAMCGGGITIARKDDWELAEIPEHQKRPKSAPKSSGPPSMLPSMRVMWLSMGDLWGTGQDRKHMRMIVAKWDKQALEQQCRPKNRNTTAVHKRFLVYANQLRGWSGFKWYVVCDVDDGGVAESTAVALPCKDLVEEALIIAELESGLKITVEQCEDLQGT